MKQRITISSPGLLHSGGMCRESYTKLYRSELDETDTKEKEVEKKELTPENIQALIDSEDLVPVRR